jgi:hypothetical protein
MSENKWGIRNDEIQILEHVNPLFPSLFSEEVALVALFYVSAFPTPFFNILSVHLGIISEKLEFVEKACTARAFSTTWTTVKTDYSFSFHR